MSSGIGLFTLGWVGGAGGGDITLLEVSAIDVIVADEEYQAVIDDDIITIIIEDE